MLPVSIIVPVWNNMQYLPRFFETFREKTKYTEYELIFVDQGSTDGSIEYLEQQPEVTLIIKNEKNTGSTGAWNQGILASSYQWMAIMNSDIEFRKEGWISRMLEEAREDVGIIECLEIIHDETTRWGGASGFFLNRKMVQDIGMFDQKNMWGFCGDTDYWIRAIWHKWKMAWCKEVVFWHWCGGTHRRGQLKASQNNDWEEGRKVLFSKWQGTAIRDGWDVPRAEMEAWLQEERKAGRLS